MAQAARITLVHATSHESSKGKFARRGAYIDTRDQSKIDYYTAQAEFDVTFINVKDSPNLKPKAATEARREQAAESKPETQAIVRLPWNDKMTKQELLGEAQRRGLGVVPEDTKGVLVEQLRADDRAAAGEPDDGDSEDEED